MQALRNEVPRITPLEVGSIVYDYILPNMEDGAPSHRFSYLVDGKARGYAYFSLDGEHITTSVAHEFDFYAISDAFAKAAIARGLRVYPYPTYPVE